jgi:hypothetical protein
MTNQKVNRQGKTWEEYDKEIAFALKNYLLIKPTKAQYKKSKSMWRQGYTISDITSYIILSSK